MNRSVIPEILRILKKEFEESDITVSDFSSSHASHYIHSTQSETHVKVQITSKKFLGLNRLERQRWIHSLLKEPLKEIHALSLMLQEREPDQ